MTVWCCGSCDGVLAADSRGLCPKCMTCPRCGQSVPKGRYCGECAKPLDLPPPAMRRDAREVLREMAEQLRARMSPARRRAHDEWRRRHLPGPEIDAEQAGAMLGGITRQEVYRL